MSKGKKPIFIASFSTIILAAGMGKRMYSKTPKILHRILGKPIISFVFDQAYNVGSDEIIIVVGENEKEVKEVLCGRIKYAAQSTPRGTGDAARIGIELSTHENILILCGDVPLLQKDTIFNLIENHKKYQADLTLLTCYVENPFGYGRILRDDDGKVVGIVEQSDATKKVQMTKEINAGVYYGKTQLILDALNKITTKNIQNEYYLTDIVAEMLKNKKKVVGFMINNEQEIMGINSKLQLAHAREIVKRQWFEKLMSRGVYIEDPSSTTIDLSVTIGKYVHIRPYTLLEGKTRIKDGSIVGPFVWMKNGKIIKYSGNA